MGEIQNLIPKFAMQILVIEFVALSFSANEKQKERFRTQVLRQSMFKVKIIKPQNSKFFEFARVLHCGVLWQKNKG